MTSHEMNATEVEALRGLIHSNNPSERTRILLEYLIRVGHEPTCDKLCEDLEQKRTPKAMKALSVRLCLTGGHVDRNGIRYIVQSDWSLLMTVAPGAGRQ